MSRRYSLLATMAAALLFPAAARACAVCLTGISEGDPVANAFNWSLLFLMSMPYAVVGSIAGWLFYAHRRAARRRSRLAEKPPILYLAWINKESGR